MKRVIFKLTAIWKILWADAHYVAAFKKDKDPFWRSCTGMTIDNASGLAEDIDEMVESSLSQEIAVSAAKNIINGVD